MIQVLFIFIFIFILSFNMVTVLAENGSDAFTVSNGDSRIEEALEYYLNKEHGVTSRPTTKIIHATAEIINGMVYEITVELTDVDNRCSVRQFGLWYRSGPLRIILIRNIQLNTDCGQPLLVHGQLK